MEGTNIPQAARTMTARQASPRSAGTSFAQAVVNALWPWLHSRRALMIAAAVVLTVGGLALGWNWLVAVGVAPILIAALPCVIMCAVGLCAMNQGNKSCSTSDSGEVRPNVSASADSARRVAMEAGDIGDTRGNAPEPALGRTESVASLANTKREENS
jgi:hypothetical protein